MKKRLLNIVGIILVILAAGLYFREIKDGRERGREQVRAANLVRMYAATPISAMGLLLDSTGPASNAFMACSTDIATNIIANLLKAERTDFPSGQVEGDEYRIFLVYTNRATAFIRAVRLYNDPSNLYVGVRQPVKFDENKQPIAWDETPPAIVHGLGTFFHDLAETNIPILRAQAPKVEEAIRSGKLSPYPQFEDAEDTIIPGTDVLEEMTPEETPSSKVKPL